IRKLLDVRRYPLKTLAVQVADGCEPYFLRMRFDRTNVGHAHAQPNDADTQSHHRTPPFVIPRRRRGTARERRAVSRLKGRKTSESRYRVTAMPIRCVSSLRTSPGDAS